jgi:hypothetical protein
MALLGLKENTELEMYPIGDTKVWVKRDDLMGDGINLPPWGKISAVYELVRKYVDPSKPLTHLSVDGSWTGWALAAICADLGIEFHFSFPDSKKINRSFISMVQTRYPEVKLNPVRSNMAKIMYNVLKKQASNNGWQMLPYAFDHSFYVDFFAHRARAYSDFDNLVVSSGSGVTVSGIAKGYLAPGKQIWTTCVSSEETINKTLRNRGINLDSVHVRKSEHGFSDRLEGYQAPFPCNQFWDVKQWRWLEENVSELKGSILFWNLGGLYSW